MNTTARNHRNTADDNHRHSDGDTTNAEMSDNTLMLVADEVIPREELELSAAEARLTEAIAAVTEEGRVDLMERERLELARNRANAEVQLAREREQLGAKVG